MAILPKDLLTRKSNPEITEFPPIHITGDLKNTKEISEKGKPTENNQADGNKKAAESKAKLSTIEQKKDSQPMKGRSGIWSSERGKLDLSTPQKKEKLVMRDPKYPNIDTVEDLIEARKADAQAAKAKSLPPGGKVSGHHPKVHK